MGKVGTACGSIALAIVRCMHGAWVGMHGACVEARDLPLEI